MVPKFGRICQILLERKKFLLLVALLYVCMQLFWSFRRSHSKNLISPTEEVWTFLQFHKLDPNGTKHTQDQQRILEKMGSRSSDYNWRQILHPETSNYDVHMEFQGSENHGKDSTLHSGNNTGSVSVNNNNNASLSNTSANKFVSGKEVGVTTSFPLLPQGQGYSGLLISETDNHFTPAALNVAIGSGLTSAKLLDLTEATMGEKMQMFQTFLPSFCATVVVTPSSSGGESVSKFNYHFYIAYDYTDKVLDELVRSGAFHRVFKTVTNKHCHKVIPLELHFVQCDHTRHPAWAQNDAMIEAYLDNIDYFYRINDDTFMKTNNWTELFIETLSTKHKPANVGVVGPSHSGGNTGILTYDFVHRTHIEIFGFHYPRLFTDWWGDDWVTMVYRPNRSTKLNSVYLRHTLALGQRYSVRDWGVGKKLVKQIERDVITLNRYVRLTEKISNSDLKIDRSRIISMALYGLKPRYIWGAIRNAQLARVLFPRWKIRFYVCKSSLKPIESTNDTDIHDHRPSNITTTTVSRRLLKRLRLLGAEIKIVRDDLIKGISPSAWRNLAVMDDNVEWLLVRDLDSRFTETEADAVEKWIDDFERYFQASGLSLTAIADFLGSFVGIHSRHYKKPAFLHVIRDHPETLGEFFPGGMWGGNARILRMVLDQALRSVLDDSAAAAASAARNDKSISGSSKSLESKIKSLNITNPYFDPGIDELVRVWSRKDLNISTKTGSETRGTMDVLCNRIAIRLKVDPMDYITCSQDDRVAVEQALIGQRYSEHELPFLDNDVNEEPVFDNIDKVSPAKVCKSIHYLTPRTKTTTTPAIARMSTPAAVPQIIADSTVAEDKNNSAPTARTT